MAAVALGPQLASAADETITLGASVQITGSKANTGRYYRDGYQFAIDKINEAGGVKVGDKTYDLKLDIVDNQSDVNLSVRQYVKLLTGDKVNFLLGPFASNFVLNDCFGGREVPGADGRGRRCLGRDLQPWLQVHLRHAAAGGRVLFLDDRHAAAPEADAQDGGAGFAADDSFDTAVAKGTRADLKKAGIKLVLDQQFRDGNGEFSSILSQIKSKNVDAIFWSGHETDALNFIRQAKSLNVNPNDFYGFTVGVPTADFRKALGNDANDAFGMTAWLPTDKLSDKWFGDAEQVRQGLEGEVSAMPPITTARRPSPMSRPMSTPSRRPVR